MRPWRRRNAPAQLTVRNRSNEHYLQRTLAKIRRKALYTVFPNDIWVDGIFPYLSIRDIIRVRQVSKLLYELTHTPMLWKNILQTVHFRLPPLPPTERYSFTALSSFETERLIVRGLNLDANWYSENPRLERKEYDPIDAYHDILSMKMIPGGHYMVASVRDSGPGHYALLLFMMDHRVYDAYPIAKTLTASKAYRIQAKYMAYEGEMGIMVAYVRREPARREDRMVNVDVSEFSDDHDIDFPVPVRYEVVVTHIKLDSISTLEDPIAAPGTAEYAEHVRTLEPPFRHVTSLKTTVSVDFLDLVEMNGDPYVFLAKSNQEIVQKNLAKRLVSRIRMSPVFEVTPPSRAVPTIRALRALGNQRQIIVVRTTTRVRPSPAELYLASLEQPADQGSYAQDVPGDQDLNDDEDEQEDEEGTHTPQEPIHQHFSLEIYNLPEDGTDTDELPRRLDMDSRSSFSSISISEYISPSTYFHESVLRRLDQRIAMPTLSTFVTHDNPWQMLHIRLKPRRVPLHPELSSSEPPNGMDEHGNDNVPASPGARPPIEETIQRYDITDGNYDWAVTPFSTRSRQNLHIFPGATRSLLMSTKLDDRSIHRVPENFFSYADLYLPTRVDLEAEYPSDREQHEAAEAERAWIDAAYRQRSSFNRVVPLSPQLADMFEDGVVAAAWDEWSGRLCLVPGSEPRKLYVLEYAHAPREDENGNRLPLPVHDVDVRFRRPTVPMDVVE